MMLLKLDGLYVQKITGLSPAEVLSLLGLERHSELTPSSVHDNSIYMPQFYLADAQLLESGDFLKAYVRLDYSGRLTWSSNLNELLKNK